MSATVACVTGTGALVITVEGVTQTFDSDAVITIGRDETATIVLDNPHVSRAHGELRQEQGQWVYRDLHSTSGSSIEGQPVTAVLINRPLDLAIAAPRGIILSLDPQPVAASEQIDVNETVALPGKARVSDSAAAARSITIGRDVSNTIVVDDLMVSRSHAVVRQTGSGMVVDDLASRNGTFVNGQRVRSAAVNEHDVISVGHSRFQLVGDHLVRTDEGRTITFGATGVTYEVGDGHRLVDDISFDLPERSLMAIVGSSGAGKSSLLGVLSGLRDPASGTVLYQGRDLHADGEELTRRIGFVPQADPAARRADCARVSAVHRAAPPLPRRDRRRTRSAHRRGAEPTRHEPSGRITHRPPLGR